MKVLVSLLLTAALTVLIATAYPSHHFSCHDVDNLVLSNLTKEVCTQSNPDDCEMSSLFCLMKSVPRNAMAGNRSDVMEIIIQNVTECGEQSNLNITAPTWIPLPECVGGHHGGHGGHAAQFCPSIILQSMGVPFDKLLDVAKCLMEKLNMMSRFTECVNNFKAM